MFRPHKIFPATILALAICVGCNSDQKATAPARGIVTVDGRPMGFGRVQFSPVSTGDALNAGKAAFGFINEDGTFSLTTYKEGDGATIGGHRVLISSRSRRAADGDEAKRPKSDIPPFENLRLVGEKFEVFADQDNSFEIKLTSDQIRRFGEQE